MQKQFIRAFCAFCLLFSLTIVSAQQKRMLTPEDYALWTASSVITNGKSQVSEDGQWCSYAIKNQHSDSTIVRNIKNKKQYTFISSQVDYFEHYGEYGSWNFSPNSKWFAVQQRDSLTVLMLMTGKQQVFYGVKYFSFLAASNKILIHKEDAIGQSIFICDLLSGADYAVTQVKEYTLDPTRSMVLVVREEMGVQQANLVRVANKCTQLTLVSGKDMRYSFFTWNKTGKAIAFAECAVPTAANTLQGKMYICQNISGTVITRVFHPANAPLLKDIQTHKLWRMRLSDDGRQLFFCVYDQRAIVPKSSITEGAGTQPVQIWAFNAKQVPPIIPAQNPPFWYCWWDNGQLMQVTNPEYPHVFFSGDQKKALIYNDKNYLPQYKYVNRFMDVYIKDLANGQQKLLLEKVIERTNEFLTSPTGKYIAYFRDKNWWVYDIAADSHRAVTSGIGPDMEDSSSQITGTIPPFGNASWLDDDNSLVVYDKYDIWIISPDGSRRKKITDGSRLNTTFRIFTHEAGEGKTDHQSTLYSSKAGILLTSVNNSTLDNGLWWWSASTGLTPLIQKDKTLLHVSKPAYKKPMLYIESDFDVSPRLMLLHRSGVSECIYRTNPQQEQFYWGKSKVVHYLTVEGKQLNGALFYPANYDATKKYPLVVEIYEKRAWEAHRYVAPSASLDQSRKTINQARFTSNGYFVFFPDIDYTLNNPGVSAAKCVIAAVRSLIDKELVDKNRVGLIGHSFGGYETAFIVTQTNLFKAAIAGAGVSDLPNYYLSMSEDFGSNITRIERDQFRMNAPFYSDEYRKNSPMDNIAAIQTPILLWSGDRDPNVDWTQTRNFHVALWRLGKKSNLLVYPGEGHSLINNNNQLDLASRIQDWFDYYLKDEKPADWIVASQGK